MHERLKPVATATSLNVDLQVAKYYSTVIPAATGILSGVVSPGQISIDSGGPPADGANIQYENNILYWTEVAGFFLTLDNGTQLTLDNGTEIIT
jgi:hypothetical protein